jgi:hypothetical protein
MEEGDVVIKKGSWEYLMVQEMLKDRPEFLRFTGCKESAFGAEAIRNLKNAFDVK